MNCPCCPWPIVSFIGPTWGPSGADRTQVGAMLASWTLLYGYLSIVVANTLSVTSLGIWSLIYTSWYTIPCHRSHMISPLISSDTLDGALHDYAFSLYLNNYDNPIALIWLRQHVALIWWPRSLYSRMLTPSHISHFFIYAHAISFFLNYFTKSFYVVTPCHGCKMCTPMHCFDIIMT